MRAREETMRSPLLGEDMLRVLPVIQMGGSDSQMLDNTLEFLYMNGMPLPLAGMVLLPEPLAPIKPVIYPLSSLNETSVNANESYFLQRFSTLTINSASTVYIEYIQYNSLKPHCQAFDGKISICVKFIRVRLHRKTGRLKTTAPPSPRGFLF